MVSSVKSGERRDILILSILPSCSAITVATWARLPGSLTLWTRIRAGKRCGMVSSISQRTSSQRSGSSSKSFSAGDVGSLEFTTPDGSHHVLDRGAREPGKRALQLVVGVFDLGAGKQAIDDAAAEAGILIAYGCAGRAADRGAGLAGNRKRFPG